jgi:predicted transcriptional regulator
MSFESAAEQARTLVENKNKYIEDIVKLVLENCDIKRGGNMYDGKKKPTLAEFSKESGIPISTLEKWIRSKK